MPLPPLVVPDRPSAQDEQGLVLPPPALRGRGAVWAVVVWFLLSTAGAALWDWIAPPPRPIAMGREQEARARREARASVLDGTTMRLLDEDRTALSNLRQTAGSVYAGLLVRELELTPESVLPGEDGWLFLRYRLMPSQGRSIDVGELWAPRLRAIERLLAGRGIDLHVLVVPRRAWVAREHVRPGTPAMPVVDQELIASLRAAGLSVIDPAPAFDREGTVTFFREDTHWSRDGQWLAAGEALAHMGLLLPPDRHPTVDPDVLVDHKQGLLNLAGVGIDTLGTRWLFPPDRGLAYALNEPWERVRQGPVGLVTAGTSYSAGEQFEPFLEQRSGLRVHRGSAPGVLSLHSLFQVLQRQELEDYRGPLLLEIPSYDMANVPVREGVPWLPNGRCDVLRLLPARELHRVVGPEAFTHVRNGNVHVLRLAMTGAGVGGDGVAYLRLKREPGGRKAMVRLRTLRQVYEVSWPGNQPVLCIAMVDGRDGTQVWQAEVFNLERGSFDPEGAAVLAPYTPRGQPVHLPAEIEGEEGAWTLRYAFDEPRELTRDHALYLPHATTAGELRLGLLSAPDAEPVWVMDARATRLGALLVGLGPAADGTWTGAVLEGRGTLPAEGLGLHLLEPSARKR